jgi:hypothetical protein
MTTDVGSVPNRLWAERAFPSIEFSIKRFHLKDQPKLKLERENFQHSGRPRFYIRLLKVFFSFFGRGGGLF